MRSTLPGSSRMATVFTAARRSRTSPQLRRALPWVANGNAADGGAAAPWFEHAFDYVGTHEITALSDGEARKYFGALFTVYALSDDEGRAKYGGDFVSAAWLVREHLYGAADKACDHWHDDAGIMNHHVGITWQLENSPAPNQTNPGLLRSPWNVNKVPHSSATTHALSDEYDGATFPLPVPGLPHDEPVDRHALQRAQRRAPRARAIMVGGLWGMNEKEWVAPLAENEDWFLLASKYMWRQGYVRCPETCSMDAPVADCFCECPSDVLAGHVADGGAEPTGVLGLFGGDAPTFNSYGISDDQLLSELCHVGLPGEMFTSAAPQDPIFWPLHGNAERSSTSASSRRRASST
ncbi:hypothetical protein JL720_16235 [Aureococcus anophagefferens]|nr:hypothetical protein JL720_16235 [Aureococcus anophagefferens]